MVVNAERNINCTNAQGIPFIGTRNFLLFESEADMNNAKARDTEQERTIQKWKQHACRRVKQPRSSGYTDVQRKHPKDTKNPSFVLNKEQ